MRASSAARRRLDALAVHEVAGIVVADARLRAARGRRAGPTSSRNSHTSRTRPARPRRRGPSQWPDSRSAAPQPAEFTTTASISPGGEGRDVARAASSCANVRVARVRVQRAAAALAARQHHLEAVAREHAHGGRVHRAEELGHHAALEERDAAAPRAATAGDARGQPAPLGARRHARAQRRAASRSARGSSGSAQRGRGAGAARAPSRSTAARSAPRAAARRGAARSARRASRARGAARRARPRRASPRASRAEARRPTDRRSRRRGSRGRGTPPRRARRRAGCRPSATPRIR